MTCRTPSWTRLLILVCCVSKSAVGIDIQLQYIWPPLMAPLGAPTNPLSVNSVADPLVPFGPPPAGVSQLMAHAASYYEDVFEDLHSIQINYWYENLSSGIGDHDLVMQGPMCADLTMATPDCRELVANVQFDAGTNWFIDFTPNSNEEFNVQQTLWRDINDDQRGDWYVFGPGVPNTFEVGFGGAAVDAASPAGTGRDLLSVVMHEVGHALGMSSSNSSTVAETEDGNYDFNRDFVFGADLAADVRDSANDALGHLDNSLAGMNGFNLVTGQRVLPSHTDLFAMASGHVYTDLDVPRREFYGGTSWHDDDNWSGHTIPAGLDESYVRDSNAATLNADGSAASLFIRENSSVSTGDHTLTVGALAGTSGKITVEGFNAGEQATLSVNGGGSVIADEIELNDGGILAVAQGAPISVDVDTLDINTGGVLIGNGSVRTLTTLQNDGLISAIAGASDELALLTGPVDLDGANGDGQVLATLGNLRISAPPVDAFDGTMTVGAGRQIEIFGTGWEIGASALTEAEINLEGGAAANPARLIKTIGSLAMNHGTLNVDGHAILEGNGVMVFGTGFETNISSGAVLSTESTMVYQGGTHQGAGELRWNGSVTVEADTTLDVHRANLDGSGTTVIQLDDSRLTVNATELDSTDNTFDGGFILSGANAGLTIALPAGDGWQMDGTIDVTGGSAADPPTALAGSPLELTGTINASNVIAITAPMDIRGTINVPLGTTRVYLEGVQHVLQATGNILGAGELYVRPGAGLQISEGASIAADLVNQGHLEVGFGVGTILAGSDFLQDGSGTLAMQLEGAPFANQDELRVVETAFLGGELEVTVLDGVMPTLGANYTLVTANSISGVFDTLTVISENPIFSYDATLFYTNVRAAIQFDDVEMLGDFDDDLSLDCADADALVAAIVSGSVDATFDLTGDGLVSQADLDQWLDVAGTHNVGGAYLLGDANLDGNVNGADFVIWNTNKFTNTAAWCLGDFNADGSTDGQDFVIWNMNKFLSADAVTTDTVPEPVGLLLLWMIISVLGTRGRGAALFGQAGQRRSAHS